MLAHFVSVRDSLNTGAIPEINLLLLVISKLHHATKNLRQGRQKGRKGTEEHHQGRQEEEAQEEGILRYLHLQGLETGPPRHRYLLKGHEHHELLHQRYLRAYRI